MSTHLKSSKNKSCRGAIDLQLSQRATYVLLNRFWGKRVELQQNLGLEINVHNAFISSLRGFALKIGMSAN
jgi:hypothetical protein